MKLSNISIWGDSIGRGIIYSEQLGRHVLCRDTYETLLKGMGINVKNYAKIGCTAPMGEELMSIDRLKGDVAVIEFGGNDSDIDWKAVSENPDRDMYPAKVSIPDFKKALTDMVKKAISYGMKPILVTPLPVEAEKYFNWVSRGLSKDNILKYLGSAEYIYRWQERYDIATREVAASENVETIDMRMKFLVQRNFSKLMSLDGIHPNEDGHKLIKETVMDLVEAM